jgi:hypothetical protein
MRRVSGFLTSLVCLAVLLPGPAHALYRTNKVGDLDLSGRIRSTNIVRHQDFDRMAFIMQRNELKLRFEWKWLQRGKAFGRYKFPWLERSDLFMVYRGIYDSIYDTTPGQIERKDLQGDYLGGDDTPSPSNIRRAALLNRLENIPKGLRDEYKFTDRLREAYIDLYFKNLPLTLRLGKQQIVWGESDGFRMLDRANTLDLSWHFFQELPPPGFGFDEIRQPFWMVKGLWDFRQLGPLSQPFFEFYWNPGDWNPGKVGFLPRPWGVKLLDPINDPVVGALTTAPVCNSEGGGSCDGGLMNGTKLFNRGNWKKNPLENSQFGARFHFITPKGFEITLNYLYQRMSPDGSPTAVVRGLPLGGRQFVHDTDGFTPGLQPGFVSNTRYCEGLAERPGSSPFTAPWAANQLCIEYFAPYIHTIGMSMNFFEGNWTQTVWRLETIIDFDLPFYDGDKQVATLDLRKGGGPISLPGITKRNMWKGMLAFDRPTWIRWLNKQSTFFITGQFFWHYIIDHERKRCSIGNIDPYLADGVTPNPAFIGFSASPDNNCGGIDSGGNEVVTFKGEQTGLVGPLDLPKLNALTGKGRDTIHQWELLGTLAALGFYRGGSLVPALIYLIDPVNSFSQELAFGIDWYVTPDFAINFATRLLWVGAPWDPYAGHKHDTDVDRGELFEPWLLGGGSRGRSESSLMFTYQF